MEFSPGIVNSCPNVLQGGTANLFFTLINTLLAAQCELGPEGRYPVDYGPHLMDGDEFDFIVVGAGSAGSVVASRLSEVEQWKVLLLEAGGYPSAATEIPGLFTSLQGTNEDWSYTMEPSSTCCARKNRCRCPKGKGLGGSSSINGMHYGRSVKHDHDKWFSDGNYGWDHDSLTEHYEKFENFEAEDSETYGTSGELHLTRYTSNHPLRQILGNAYKELGYNVYTEDNPIGYKDSLRNIYNGTRQSTAKAFLAPVRNRKNLYVAINAKVEKLTIHDKKVVKGVELTIKNRRLKVSARKEVILSAGNVNSPQILMNSGIGPREHLSVMGIEVVKELGVGDNLHDHLILPALGVTLDKSTMQPSTPEQMLDALYYMFLHRDDDQDMTNFVSFVSSENTSISDIEFMHVPIRQNEGFMLDELIGPLGISDDVATALREHNQNAPLLLFFPFLLAPKSRGTIRLRSPDASSKPLITPNCISDAYGHDIEILLDAVKFVQKLIKTRAFEKHAPKMIDFDIASCRSYAAQSDDFWRCAIRHLATPAYQQVGTCKMGPITDTAAVVDHRLEVHGVKGVRVIDVSVLPMLRSNPYGPAIMVGEKGAEMIKEDWYNERNEM